MTIKDALQAHQEAEKALTLARLHLDGAITEAVNSGEITMYAAAQITGFSQPTIARIIKDSRRRTLLHDFIYRLPASADIAVVAEPEGDLTVRTLRLQGRPNGAKVFYDIESGKEVGLALGGKQWVRLNSREVEEIKKSALYFDKNGIATPGLQGKFYREFDSHFMQKSK